MRKFFFSFLAFSYQVTLHIYLLDLSSLKTFAIFSVIPHARFRHTSHHSLKSLFLKLCLQIFIILYIHLSNFFIYAYIIGYIYLIQALMRKNGIRLFLGMFSNRSREKRSTDNFNVFQEYTRKRRNWLGGPKKRNYWLSIPSASKNYWHNKKRLS